MIYLDVAKIIRPKFQIEIIIPTESQDSQALLDLMVNVEALLMAWMKSYLANTPEEATLTIGVVYPGKKK